MNSAKATKTGHDRDQVLQAAAEPVRGGDHEGVAGAYVVQAGGEFFAFGVLPGFLVGEGFLVSGCLQGVRPAVEVLVPGRYAGVSDQCSSPVDRVQGIAVEGERFECIGVRHPLIVQKRVFRY
nr:hypothetical protein [Nocardia paucivorans]